MGKIKIYFSGLNYSLIKKPIIVGGKALQFYELRESNTVFDLLVRYRVEVIVGDKIPPTGIN
jgi:hypothetical protein